MEKEFIPYEQALALKELGFDEKCLGFYYDEKGNVFHNSLILSYLIAPLYQQAFRWLLTLVNKDEHFGNKWSISYNGDYYSLFSGGCNMGVFKTELECLKELIEILKQK
jgi:hypothetical protein